MSEQPPVSPTQPSGYNPPRLGLAIASMVLGIVAVCLSLVVVGALLGVVGLALGIVHLRRKQPSNGMAWAGIALSACSLVFSALMGVIYYKAYQQVAGMMQGQGGGSDIQQWEGVLAPNITVKTLDGEALDLESLRGKRVVLDFWATWCPPCVKEIPHFIQLHNETSRDDLVIVGVSDEEVSKLRPFVKKHKVNYPIGTADRVAPYDDIKSIPTTFFIDRKGVIQSIAVGYREYDDLKKMALAEDYVGEPKSPPTEPASGLSDAAHPLKPVVSWSTNVPGANALAVGNWDGDPAPEILVAAGNQLHVFSADGAEETTVKLPETFASIEVGRAGKDPRLLGYSNWGKQVVVTDSSGKQLWNYSSMMGVNGAHWGDLDKDGKDELIVGMNGGGGLHAVTPDGKKIWAERKIGNVWNQAVIPAREGGETLVFATEAGGTVRVYDPKGKLLRTLRPQGEYCSQMTAATIDSSGTIQVLAMGGGEIMAFDDTGRVAWTTPTDEKTRSWRVRTFASGDVNGDSESDWAFGDDSGNLVVANAKGEKLASLKAPPNLKDFVIVPNGKSGILVIVHGSTLTAHAFEPEAGPESAGARP